MKESILVDISPMLIQQAQSQQDLLGILQLQQANLKQNVSQETQTKEGFVTVLHTLEILEEMNQLLGQVIAKQDEQVIGYALSMAQEIAPRLPILLPMFDKINGLTYQGNSLQNSAYYVMGQVCIAQGYRGQGIFQKMYDKHKACFSSDFDYCITEVSTSNTRSMKAHVKLGFETIHSFTDETDEWNILLWDWREKFQKN